MKKDIINMFEDILTEVNWAAERDSQIEQSRSAKAHSKDNEEDKASKNEDEDESKDNEDEVSDEEESESLDDDESDNKLDDLKIEDALKYSKLKRSINKFRSSHSIKDPDVNSELEKFYDNLSNPEKKILYVLLHGLTQVTLLDISGSSAYTPGDHGLKVVESGKASEEKIDSKEKEQKLSINASDEEVKKITNSPITAIKVGGA